jgi:hypothetical protein
MLEKRVRKAAKSFLKKRGIYIPNFTIRTSIPKQLHEFLEIKKIAKMAKKRNKGNNCNKSEVYDTTNVTISIAISVTSKHARGLTFVNTP